jgi:hypothetical protein
MMQFLKSILFPVNKKQIALEERVNILEKQIIEASKIMSELNICVQTLGDGMHQISSELLIITQVIEQAASIQQSENDYFTWRTDDDDDGYLN